MWVTLPLPTRDLVNVAPNYFSQEGSRTRCGVAATRSVHALDGLALLRSGRSSSLVAAVDARGGGVLYDLLVLLADLLPKGDSKRTLAATPWAWLPAPVSTTLSAEPSPLRGMFGDVLRLGCEGFEWCSIC